MAVSTELTKTYCDRRVLVTGHTGFKGGWLCTWLAELGARVTGISLQPDTHPNLFSVIDVSKCLSSHICDIREGKSLRQVIGDAQPEIVFHLAAQPLVRRSYADPIGTLETNVLGTANVLEAVRACPSVRAVVVVTTDKVYDNQESGHSFRETDPLGGLDPYSASKAAAEIVAAVYQKNLCAGRVAIATARGGNVIGGGDWSEDRIVPDIVRAIVTDVPVVLRHPSAIRPWQHVLELTEAYLELGAKLLASDFTFAEPWNIGPRAGEELTVAKLAELMITSWKDASSTIQIQPSSLHEAGVLRLDISKALSRLSWRPRLGIRETLQWTVDWYKKYYDNPANARAITLEQIRSFEARSPAP
jgi:CDP-glucose 4,6-dehydratase